MNTAIFRFFAVLILLMENFVFQVWFLEGDYRLYDQEYTVRMVIALFVGITIAVGLIYLRRWAAVYLSIITAAAAALLMLLYYPFAPHVPYIVNFSLAVLLMIPAVATIQYWRNLSAGGKWYF